MNQNGQPVAKAPAKEPRTKHGARLEAVATRCLEALAKFDASQLRDLLNKHPEKFPTVALAVARLNHQLLVLRRLRAEMRAEQAARPRPSGQPGLTPETHGHIVEHLNLL